jgi:hypothetical protein
MTMNNNLPKDPMILVRSTLKGKNSKGADRYQLYFTQEMALELIGVLTANIENPKGVKLDLHIAEKEKDGRKFLSSFAFVKAVSDSPQNSAGGPSRYQAQPKMSPEDMAAKMAALKAAQLKG